MQIRRPIAANLTKLIVWRDKPGREGQSLVKVMDKTKNADRNEVDRHNEVQQAWHQQNEYSGN